VPLIIKSLAIEKPQEFLRLFYFIEDLSEKVAGLQPGFFSFPDAKWERISEELRVCLQRLSDFY
jgi:hypothetical protein